MLTRYLFMLIAGELTFIRFAQYLLFSVLAVFIAMTVHEFAHAFAAYAQGDETSRLNGRMSLNPFRHIDPVGFGLLLVFGIGFARPVRVNPRRFKHMRSGMILTAAAGPLANILTAFLFTAAWIATLFFGQPTVFFDNLTVMISFIVSYNLYLALFNLIPIPPLDGSKIVGELLPANLRFKYYNLERFYMYFIIAFILILNRFDFIDLAATWLLNIFQDLLIPLFLML